MQGRGVAGAAAAAAAIAIVVTTGALAHPLTPLAPLTASDAAPSLEFGALVPALIAALFLITLVLVLGGCVCCKRNKFKQFTNGASNDIPELVGSSSIQINNVSTASIDTGIVNPIADREFTIFGPLAPDGQPRPYGSNAVSPDLPRIGNSLYNSVDAVNNNPLFDNNNGPISPQELENIYNNNANDYIASENENRNLNNDLNDENVVIEEVQIPRAISSTHQEPLNDNSNNLRFVENDSHRKWFENEKFEITRNQLEYLREIGRGWFGRIIEAKICDNTENNFSPNTNDITRISKVAVKTLEENISFSRKRNFLDECELYRDSTHEHVLKLIGVNLSQDPWLILFEYCALGDMKTFLQSNKSNSLSLISQGIPIKLQCEIVSAVSYLHSINVILPDIACHCCMVTEGFSAKLGDYGGSQSLHSSDFYNISGNELIPLRWIAPECLRKTITKAGNVWSLGVFLWESCSWGMLPYESLDNEQIITDVLCQNGLRLQQPHNVPEYITYIFQVMQLCWQYSPSDRLTSEQVLSLLQYIYSSHFESSEKKIITQRSSDDFDARWQNLKPNTIPKIDNGHPVSNTELSDFKNNLLSPECSYGDADKGTKFDTASISTAEMDASTEILIDNFSEKTKSDSLTNLHGSLESMNRSPMEIDLNTEKDSNLSSQCLPSDDTSPMGRTSDEILTVNSYLAHCAVAPWLQDLPVNSQEDMSYIKTVSDVISDLDNMLSSEKTSSSESSHQTSPSRDVLKSTLSCDNNSLCPTFGDVLECSDRLEKSVNSENTDLSQSSSICSASKSTNVNQNNATQNVPEFNSTKSTTKADLYPTLDFRLAKLENAYDAKNEVYPIFQTKFTNDGQDYDSLQDSSYIPSDSLNVGVNEQNNIESNLNRQSSSGSETEDEIWKKRIEIGALTEKIKLKSKSVTDFMVLTHIDMDFTDLDSEDTSYTSVDGRFSILPTDMLKKKLMYDHPQKDSSLPTVECLTFPKYFQSSSAYQNEIISKPSIDFKKLKKNIFDTVQRNLRPTKSLDDISSLNPKCISSKDSLILFKKNIDCFLCDSPLNKNDISEFPKNLDKTLVTPDSKNVTSCETKRGDMLNDTWESTKYLDINDLSVTLPQHQTELNKKSNNIDSCDSKNTTNGLSDKVENSNGNSTQNDHPIESNCSNNSNQSISNNCSSIEKPLNSKNFFENPQKLIKSTKTSILPNIERNSTYVKSISIGDYHINKLEQNYVNDDIVKEKCQQNETGSSSSNVVMGPFFDCTLDLYTGIKTDFKENEIPEEEALMFSSNFNDVHANFPSNNSKNDTNVNDLSSSYFFNCPTTNKESKCDKPIDYSIETWDRFLGSSFEDTSKNFDSIFPDTAEKSDTSADVPANDNVVQSSELPQTTDHPESNLPVPADESMPPVNEVKEVNLAHDAEQNDHIAESSNNINNSIDISNLASNSRFIDIVSQTDLNNLTSKLAIAENENNLNIENSNPSFSDDLNDTPNNTAEIIINLHSQEEEEEEHPDADIEKSDNVVNGWFLHNKVKNSESAQASTSRDVPSTSNDCDSNDESLDDKSDSIIDRVIDPESVQALRNELELKLPLAQKMAQAIQESAVSEKGRAESGEYESTSQSEDLNVNKNGNNRENFNPTHQRSSEYNCGKNIFNEQDVSKNPDTQIPRNEVLIQYNIYGPVPLSPIQEESWSEFSDLVKAGEFDKSDTSNSLSLGQLNSIVVAELPLDAESSVEKEGNHRTWSDDETNDDSHGSNRTFVALDGFESAQPDKKKSISVDSLNCIEDQMDIDDDVHRIIRPNEINVHEIPQMENPITELLSPFYEDHSNTKSTEEISQNVDHLLENISKTLEDASKVGSVSSECIVYPNVDEEANDKSENNSVISVENDSATHTYVIEGKNNDLTYTCPNKVINVPEDVSNVSKISQPSFVSDISSLNSESQMRPSEKSSQIFHSKTASIDSWCSNDTLFNVEENFDDICSSNDFMDMAHDRFSDSERRSVTPTNDNYKYSLDKPGLLKTNELLSCRHSMSLDNDSLMHPPLESVMNYPASVSTNDINLEIQNMSPLIPDNINYLNNQVSPVILSSPKMFLVTDTENISHVLPNSSDSNGTSFSEKSSTDIISVLQNESNEASTSNVQSDKPCNGEKISITNESVVESCPRREFVSPKIDSLNAHCDQMKTSTPLEILNSQVAEEDTAVDSAENIIDRQFEFLDTIDHSISKIDDSENNGEKLHVPEGSSVVSHSHQHNSENDHFGKPLILNYVNVDQDANNYKNICNITDKFIEMEKNIPYDDINFTNDKYQLDANLDLGKKSEFSESQNSVKNLSDTNDDISKNLNQNIKTNSVSSDASDFVLSSTSYDDFLRSIEGKDQDLTNFENSDSKKNHSFEDAKNVSDKYYDEYGSSLSEYIAHSGLNMESFGHTPENREIYSDQNISNANLLQPNFINSEGKSYNQDGVGNDASLINNRLSYIHFSGPINESTASEDYFLRNLNTIEDVNNIAPECLKDWDSGSEESNGNSSSSGEFTWRKGDAEESVVLSASFCTQSNNKQKNSEAIPINQEYDTIPEEVLSQSGESADGSGDEEEVEFIPSSWDYSAIPSKSALKSPDSSQSEEESTSSESRKKVAFKKQKYHCVYEYPREIVESEIESPHLAGSSSYSDWQTYCNEADSQYDKFIESCPNDYNSSSVASSDIPVPDEDFYITSSTSPFESYSFLNSSSQFFPGHHLSLLSDVKPYDAEFDEIDDNTPLPPVPQELLEYNSEDYVNNMISNILANSKTQDYITPDSGTEDVTPGSLLDEFEFKDMPVEKKPADTPVQSDEVDSSKAPSKLSSHELSLNLTNKLKSSNCASLTLIDKGSPSGSLTPSTPSPSAVANSNHSSGSTSPLQITTSVLGGLRHTRDKLKLDLPPSPLSRNSPSSLNSGKNLGEMKIFDFKLEPENKETESEQVVKINDEDTSKLLNNSLNGLNHDKSNLSNDEDISNSDAKSASIDTKSELNVVLEKIKAYESLDSNSPLSPLDKNSSIGQQQDLDDHSYNQKQASSMESFPSDHITLQKAVAPINIDESAKKSHLEPVKGEGTLLDSGDEDSGIGSSAYTTLERKIEHVQAESHLVGESR